MGTSNLRSVGSLWLGVGGRRTGRGGGRGEVKKTSKIDFQEKTFPEVFRCGDFEVEVCWVTMVRGGWAKRGEERSKKHRKSIFTRRHFQRYFDTGTSNLRSVGSP